MAGDKDGGGAFQTTGYENGTREVKHCEQILVVKSAHKSSTKGVLSAQWPVSALFAMIEGDLTCQPLKSHRHSHLSARKYGRVTSSHGSCSPPTFRRQACLCPGQPGCHDKIPPTGGFNDSNLCLTVLKTGKSEIKVMDDKVENRGVT
ncbi:uncharacterized protein AAES06_013455 [Glossophaga mutica]